MHNIGDVSILEGCVSRPTSSLGTDVEPDPSDGHTFQGKEWARQSPLRNSGRAVITGINRNDSHGVFVLSVM